jgi:hypothetical protein
MTNMNPYRIQFINGYIEVEERKSPNGTPEAKCTLHPMAQTAMLFREVVAWANENNYTHTKLLMRGGDPYVVAWQQISTEELE